MVSRSPRDTGFMGTDNSSSIFMRHFYPTLISKFFSENFLGVFRFINIASLSSINIPFLIKEYKEMRIKTAVTGFAVILIVMSLIGGFSAFLRHYIIGTPNLVEQHDVLIKELHPEKFIDKEE